MEAIICGFIYMITLLTVGRITGRLFCQELSPRRKSYSGRGPAILPQLTFRSHILLCRKQPQLTKRRQLPALPNMSSENLAAFDSFPWSSVLPAHKTCCLFSSGQERKTPEALFELSLSEIPHLFSSSFSSLETFPRNKHLHYSSL